MKNFSYIEDGMSPAPIGIPTSAGTMSMDIKGIALPLLGLIRRTIPSMSGGAPGKRHKKRKRKFSEEMEILSMSMGLPSYQKTFPQPTMVSVKSMTKKGFWNAKKKKPKYTLAKK